MRLWVGARHSEANRGLIRYPPLMSALSLTSDLAGNASPLRLGCPI